MNAPTRIAIFSVASGMIWSVIATLPMGDATFSFGPNLIAGIATSFLVSFVLWQPLLKLKAWLRFVCVMFSFPMGVLCFFVCYFLCSMLQDAPGMSRVPLDEVPGQMLGSFAYSLQLTMSVLLMPVFAFVLFLLFGLNVWLLRLLLMRGQREG